ncbi:RtcB family protein [Halorarum salinum]|uniref:tRNA-splicing ligase RtcB n=1 Tax=Halorarum salinum TaxID=2743089 RepID=A0A7D5Q8M8_9EURY|nr:RtcB family protein [Halobaculum salinum]QLG61136.1 RtcB family protein [Halobaculum salinum]
MTEGTQLAEVAENVYEIPRRDDMRVPARVYGSASLIEEMRAEGDLTLSQIRNVATLPGIRKFALVLPDGHQGYGFPIGGVAAVDLEDGVISPGGIGFDVNCGVRVLRTDLTADDVDGSEADLADLLYEAIPTGLGKGGYLDTDLGDVREILERGLGWMHENGYATEADLAHCEENGRLPGDAGKVPAEALTRGVNQVGSLGSGNHFLEVQRVAELHDAKTAAAYGLREDQVVVMIHSGSRGLGHQTCTEYVRKFERGYPGIADSLPDRQLIYAPLGERLADDYWAAMNAAANFAWANRQAMTHAVRAVLGDRFGDPAVELLYDVCHNIAKRERHAVDGGQTEVLVHRKGATRAFPAGRPEVPAAYREVGQPVLIPGSMGTNSYVLAGGPRSLDLTFGSTAHGAGRVMSRTRAKSEYSAGELRRTLRGEGIYVRARSGGTLTEEAPGAYKDVDEVIRVSDALGIGTRVARLRPMATIKG